MRPKLVLAGTLALLLAILFAQNYQVVEVRFLFWEVAMSRALMLLCVLAIGMALGWLLATRNRFARRR